MSIIKKIAFVSFSLAILSTANCFSESEIARGEAHHAQEGHRPAEEHHDINRNQNLQRDRAFERGAETGAQINQGGGNQIYVEPNNNNPYPYNNGVPTPANQ